MADNLMQTRFGSREICNVVFKAKSQKKIGNKTFEKGEPVYIFDSLKTSSLESAATSVYATGGRGNSRLVAWEGEKTVTFTMEDALISPLTFSILSGAGLDEYSEIVAKVHFSETFKCEEAGKIDIASKMPTVRTGLTGGIVAPGTTGTADFYTIYAYQIDEYGNMGVPVEGAMAAAKPEPATGEALTVISNENFKVNEYYMIDCYVYANASTLTVTPENFAGTYYIEAETLFRREQDGVDLPAQFIIPKGKVQSNYTFSMASTGDPSTFTFTVDAFPDYVQFDRSKKVLFAINILG